MAYEVPAVWRQSAAILKESAQLSMRLRSVLFNLEEMIKKVGEGHHATLIVEGTSDVDYAMEATRADVYALRKATEVSLAASVTELTDLMNTLLAPDGVFDQVLDGWEPMD